MKDIKVLALENAVKHKGEANPRTVIGHLLAKNPSLRKKSGEVVAEVNKFVKEINSWDLEKQIDELKKLDPGRLKKKKIGRSYCNFIKEYQPQKGYLINLSIKGEKKVNNTRINFIYPYELIFI